MGCLRIYCGTCGGSWDVRSGEDWHSRRSRTCPGCESAIDGQTWEKQILPALGGMLDANMELRKDHTGYGTPMFRVEYIEDPKQEDQEAPDISEIEARLDDLEDSVREMTLAFKAVAMGKGGNVDEDVK